MSAVRFALPVAQRVAALLPAERDRLLQRGRATDANVSSDVARIIAAVRDQGDEQLLELARRFDRVELTALEIPREACAAALRGLPANVRSALEHAAAAIRGFHASQLPFDSEIEIRRGVRLGRRAEPLQRVGVYAPGGRAAYPSSVLMGAVPARVAGVQEVVLCSPPGPTGLPPAAVLAAAAIAQVDRVFAIGGAGAIAALAYGTSTVPRVDKIVGPGNAYVTEAKRQLTGVVAIDSPAGPSEILILADDSADARLAALELSAQAEHDPDASAVLVSTSEAQLSQVFVALNELTATAPRGDVVRAALAQNGALLLAADNDELVAFANAYAPEHLLVLTAQPRALLPRLRNAGSIFLGSHSSVAFGDYITGANHVLPTAGLARAYAGLSTADFVRWSTYQEVSAAAARELAGVTALLADTEGLPGHAAAARAHEGATTTDTTAPALRAAYAGLELYDPKRAPIEIDLSDNTNLFGVAPAAQRVLSDLPSRDVTRYPQVFAASLKEAIAAWYGVAPENVTTGCGSDDVIDSALRAFCERGDRVVYPSPTFSMVREFARMNALLPVPIEDGFSNIDRVIDAGGRVTYVCNPNNPTGSVVERAAVERLADRASGVVLIDEAYADFAEDNFARLSLESPRVVSLRTFSKAFGLAGLRIGFALGPAELIHEIEKSRGPYKVNAPAAAAAVAVLQEDRAWIEDGIRQVKANRQRLARELTALGYAPLPAQSNFLCVPVKEGQSAAHLATSLRTRGVAVRPFPALPGLGDCIRVTVGPWALMQRFLEELQAV